MFCHFDKLLSFGAAVDSLHPVLASREPDTTVGTNSWHLQIRIGSHQGAIASYNKYQEFSIEQRTVKYYKLTLYLYNYTSFLPLFSSLDLYVVESC